MKPILPFVETMITQVCNLSCLGCTNYSDLPQKGYVTWKDGCQQIESWLERINIPDFGIMGGEPLINPQVREWIIGSRELLPDSQIRFTTNGLLLDKNIDIIDLFSDIGNCVFKITVHQASTEIEDIIEYIMSKYNWTPVVEYGVSRFKTGNNVRFQVNRPKTFIKTYQGTYSDMRPYHSDPQKSFEICCQKTCPLLHQGRIYKCSTSGLLKETLERFGNPNLEQWNPYIVNGIDPGCSDMDLLTFIENFGRPEATCGQCPTATDVTSVVNHYETVSFKKYK